jgi:hypothetical protein
MTKWTLQQGALVALILLLCCGTQAQTLTDDTARNKALQDGWPDTPVGLMASAWIEAFSSDEETMRSFLDKNLPEQSLKERPMKQRLSSWRQLNARFGNLMLSSVVESSATELTAMILADDGAQYRFIFKVEKQAPHRLLSVGIVQPGHGHGGH